MSALGKRRRTKSGGSRRPLQYARTTGTSSSSRGRIARRSRGYTRTGGYYGRYGPQAITGGNEAKFFTPTQDVSTITSAGIIAYISLNRIPQGVTESTRVGRKCVITKIHLRGRIEKEADANASAAQARVILYMDKQANGATAAVGDILTSASELSYNNLSNSQRFIILKDWFVTLTANGWDSTSSQWGEKWAPLKFNKKCNIPIEFSSTTGAITEIRSNNIGVLAICSANATGDMTLTLSSRIRFSDQ